jgi:heat shock protein HslJ
LGEGNRIQFGRIGSTRRAGPPEAMAQEAKYLKQLEQVSSWTVKGNQLVLTNANQSFSLIFATK